jgi:predicted phosphodiesterase
MVNLHSRLALIVAVLAFLSSCRVAAEEKVDPIEFLDRSAVFTFAIISDNNGESPKSNPQFARMVEWVKSADCRFVIGMGDHVKKGLENSFLDFLKTDQWWRERFYPCVADGENDYYGESQADWGAGAPILDTVALRSRDGVEIRPNGCEYYAKIPSGQYTVHVIMAHFPDEPSNAAFKEESRQWVSDTVGSIKKGPYDLIVIGAHSRYGSWLELLSDTQKQPLMEKADLILSATIHFWGKVNAPSHEWSGPLCINTGSVTHPNFGSKPGYVQVHVLENPTRLVVQYVDCSASVRTIQPVDRCFVKEIGGRIRTSDLSPKQ